MASEASVLKKLVTWARTAGGDLRAAPLQHFFAAPLRPITFPGLGDAPMWAATGYDPENLVGISERFLGKADIYTATYTHSENILDLLRRAIALNGVQVDQVRTVLDFGSGPGTNTVFPLHVIDPSLRIVATDISLNLLATLSRLLDQHPHRDLVDIVAWDCMSGGIRPATFDLVTGASLLHHLMDPRDALRAAAQALRPGGCAVFFDPFDGAGVIRGMFQAILNADVGRNDRLSDAAKGTMELLSRDYEARLAGSEPEHFKYLEDKWIFAPEQIVAWGREAGFSEVIVRGNQDHPGMYRDYALMQLRMALPEAAELPDWAVQIMESVDASLTPAVRRRMLLEGTIVMRR